MEENKKLILLITYDNWGYNQYIADALEKKSYRVKHIDFHSFQYQYPGIPHKFFNFFIKNLGIANLKQRHYNDNILNKLKTDEKIDTTIYIKADFLSKKTIETINKNSQKSVLFINDSISRYPMTKRKLPLFDKVFSFEKKDCAQYGLIFKTNFIYKSVKTFSTGNKYKVFNISSFDKRFPFLKKIAKTLYNLNISSKIIVYTSKENQYPYLEFSASPLSISEIDKYLEQSEIMLDVHRGSQEGLSFRVFESLGFRKKLITTNKDIRNYDFFNEQNIFIIDDIDNISIPKSFLETPYLEIPENILDKYLVENWVEELII